MNAFYCFFGRRLSVCPSIHPCMHSGLWWRQLNHSRLDRSIDERRHLDSVFTAPCYCMGRYCQSMLSVPPSVCLSVRPWRWWPLIICRAIWNSNNWQNLSHLVPRKHLQGGIRKFGVFRPISRRISEGWEIRPKLLLQSLIGSHVSRFKWHKNHRPWTTLKGHYIYALCCVNHASFGVRH